MRASARFEGNAGCDIHTEGYQLSEPLLLHYLYYYNYNYYYYYYYYFYYYYYYYYYYYWY